MKFVFPTHLIRQLQRHLVQLVAGLIVALTIAIVAASAWLVLSPTELTPASRVVRQSTEVDRAAVNATLEQLRSRPSPTLDELPAVFRSPAVDTSASSR